MARILPDVSAATGPLTPTRQRFFNKVESDEDKALKIMQAISGGVRTASDLYTVGTDIYDRAKETPEEALARVQKEAYEQNLATRQSELDRVEREALGVTDAVKSRMEVLERVREGRQGLQQDYESGQFRRLRAGEAGSYQIPVESFGFESRRRPVGSQESWKESRFDVPDLSSSALTEKPAPSSKLAGQPGASATPSQPTTLEDRVIANWGEFKQLAPQYGISREWIESGDFKGLGPKAGETYMGFARRVGQASPQPEATGPIAPAPAAALPVIDVVTMQKISPRLPPAVRARLRAMTKAAIEEGRATLPNREQLTRLQIESDSTPQKQEVLLRAVSEIESQQTARPITEQLDELMAYEQFTTDDLVMLVRQARTPEEAMQVARAADMALDVVPSSALPGARTDRGQDLAATIEARRKVLNAYKQRKPMSLKDMAKIRLDLAKANKAQAEADKLSRRGKGPRRPRIPDNKWRQAMKLAGVPMSGKRKLVEADKKGFVRRIRAGAFSGLGSSEEAFAKIQAETGLNLRNLFLPEPDKVDPVKPEASPAMKGSVKRAAQHEKDLRKANTSARSAVRKLEALGVGTEVFPGVKNIPDIEASSPDAIVAFATSLLSENVVPAGETPPINPTMLGKVVNDLITAVTTAEVARAGLKRSTSEAAAASNPFSSAPERVALPPVSTPRNPTALEMLQDVLEQVPKPGSGQ